MSVPPSGRQPSSTPSSKGKPDETGKRSDRDFKLPPKKQKTEGKEEQPKKKGLFDIAAEEMKMQDKQQGLSQELKTEEIKTQGITASAAIAQVRQVGQLIESMVETMHIGQIDGQNLASLDLKRSPEVPEAFAGSHLTLSYQENGLSIHFDNFMTPQQQNTAITLVEKNKEQLVQMVQALNAKNIQVTELAIGNHMVALPKIAPLPPPFQPTLTTQAETEQQQRDRGGQREEGEGEPR